MKTRENQFRILQTSTFLISPITLQAVGYSIGRDVQAIRRPCEATSHLTAMFCVCFFFCPLPPLPLPISGVLLEEDKGNLRYVTLSVTFEFIICEMLQGPIKIE